MNLSDVLSMQIFNNGTYNMVHSQQSFLHDYFVYLYSTSYSRCNETPLRPLSQGPYPAKQLWREEDHRIDSGGHLKQRQGNCQD
jgi:hypothetical protein